MLANLIKKDLSHIWHPCSYMDDFKAHPPLVIKSAKGSFIKTNNGILIDGISSWWCKSLGHGHPKIITAIKNQLDKFEHVITANTTNKTIVDLAEKLEEISNKQHVFFASDGSSAVEIAMKLAMHSCKIKGYNKRTKFISLKNSYHGDTFAAMSVSDLDLYKKNYSDFGFNTKQINNIPYINFATDPSWNSCEQTWQSVLPELEKIKNETIAIIFEPIVQGAAGMLCYSADFLKRIAEFAKNNNIYLIADEIMTGMGRTGKWLASEHANISPDLICLSKGITSGSLPLSLVLIDNAIYETFDHFYKSDNAFLHSHTYGGNPLAISAALATITVMQEENINNMAENLGNYMRKQFSALMTSLDGKLTNMRSIGAMVAADLVHHSKDRIGFKIAQEAQKTGALLRPIGNSIYWLPPLNIEHKTIDTLAEITHNAIIKIYQDENLCSA